jgi:secondary thiamine-phosphate synthase enzyme
LTVLSKRISLQTKGENQIINITQEVRSEVRETKLKDGIVTIFVPGSTGALTTIEYEPGLIEDFPNMLERIAPKTASYIHEKRWHDGNGHSHVRASLIGPSITVPFIKGELTLGTWQQIVFLELDINHRNRNLVIQIIGE